MIGSKLGPVIVSLKGTALLTKERELLKHPKVGGVVLFRDNWDSKADAPKESLKKLIAEIRSINPRLLLMVDHEGGKVWRFEKGFTKISSAKTFGNLYDKDKETALKFAFEQGKIMAQELLACNVDMSLAPVLDLDGDSNVIGKFSRAFHKDPKIVSEIAERFIQGMNAAGMVGVAKHFPGHGTCSADSHVELPVDNRSLEALQKDLYPFRTMIEKGLIGAIMPAHVLYPVIDEENPAGFSKIWIKGCLRAGLGYSGVVMSDCLSMKGAAVGSTLARLLAAQNAGCDFLMFTGQHGKLLDDLLVALNQLPDNKDEESAVRRERLAASIKRAPMGNITPLYAINTPKAETHSGAAPASAEATAAAATGAKMEITNK